MKQYKKLIAIVGAVIIISNVPPFSSIFHLVFDGERYRYSNADGSFTFQEIWLRDYENMMRVYQQKSKRSRLKDREVYRLFRKNPLAFWRWKAYLTDKRYNLPYKNWNEIERLRDKKQLRNKFVDF